jgi:hypothetical protein
LKSSKTRLAKRRISFGIKTPATGQLEQVGYLDNDGFHGKVVQ